MDYTLFKAKRERLLQQQNNTLAIVCRMQPVFVNHASVTACLDDIGNEIRACMLDLEDISEYYFANAYGKHEDKMFSSVNKRFNKARNYLRGLIETITDYVTTGDDRNTVCGNCVARFTDYDIATKINCKAHFNKAGNIKLGRGMWSFSKLYGDQMHYIAKYNRFVKGSCGGNCAGCKESCYVRKSYRYGSVIQCHGENTLAMRADCEKAFADMETQINRSKNKPEIIRIHQSGELETVQEFKLWIALAAKFPGIQFYVYTKAFSIVVPVILEKFTAGELPENFTILFSVWHGYGIAQYNRCRHIPNVKAFVYCDNYDYSQHNLEIGTKCRAYTGTKLNHEITCDKCRKCFDRSANHAVIGCDSH